MAFTEGALSPELFRLWTGIALVAGACERRVWLRSGRNVTFPNLYTLLVAPPGVGKQVIEDARELWNEAQSPSTRSQAFKVAPDSMTKASLVDNLARAKTNKLLKGLTGPLVYHSLLIAAEEFSVMLPAYDLEYIGVLNKIYNNPNTPYAESRRTGSVREVEIEYAQLNILGGAQPGWLKSVFPEEAWSTGLTSRMLMVYCSDAPLLDIFADNAATDQARSAIVKRLGEISEVYGELAWTEPARERLRQWHLAGGPPTPTHSRLVHYVRRRTLHALKLTIVSAISRRSFEQVELIDVERAITWLIQIEQLMPDIFRAMIGKSDAAILEELHHYLVAHWQMRKQMPIREQEIVSWLAARIPSDRIIKMIEIAERAGLMERFAGTTTYKPLPRQEGMLE